MDSLLRRLGDEVRESLHQIMGMLELAREEPLSANQQQYLARCRASADQLLCAANDLAELARTDFPAPQSAPFQLEGVIQEVAWLMSHMADRKGAEFTWNLDANVPAAGMGDALLVQDLLRRIIESALHLVPRGKIHLEVKPGNEGTLHLDVLAEAAGDRLSDPEFLTAEGLGPALGLSIVRKRLDQLRGVLTTSTESRRAKLIMIVPYGPVGNAAWRVSNDGRQPGAPLNLLVAEDSDDSFFLLQAYMAHEGHRMTRALNGAEAVEMAKSGHYDFVVMDIKMPVMDGYTATRLIREWETEQGRVRLPILLLSAEEAARQMRIGANAGCSGYLTKPATKAQVLTALDFYAHPKTRAAS